MTRSLTVLFLVTLGNVALAQSPNVNDSFRPGANHHLGDDAFRAKYGRNPTDVDEKLRIKTHFEAVRDLLRSHPATRPELEKRRAQILSYFDAYIAKGTTPKNERLPWRTPVFIDNEGTICAVGYLIEQSVGRPVAEKIAATHRYSYIEEIAAAMPEVRDWIAASGFTLDELSLIQPGYEGPSIDHVTAWNPKKDKIADGAYAEGGVQGTLARHQMEGDWSRSNDSGNVLGRGHFAHGAGKWTSFYPDGKRLAEGAYAENQPTGTWKIFHPSGNLAAEGRLVHGSREGEWHFYYDTDRKVPIAIGSFEHADLVGTWKHFDASGHLLATERPSREGFSEKDGLLGMFQLDIVPGPDGVRHRVHEGNSGGDSTRLDELISANGEERIYVTNLNHAFDANGFELVQEGTTMVSKDCRWNAARKHAARRGQLSQLHKLVWLDAESSDEEANDCGAATPIPQARAATLEAMLASVRAVRAQTPDFMRAVALGETTVDEADAAAVKKPELQDAFTKRDDLAKILAANMVWYVEWPHVDGKFEVLYETLPGVQTMGQ